jgi:hypothetical protein
VAVPDVAPEPEVIHVIVPEVVEEDSAVVDLSVGPGNVEQPPLFVEPGRRRARTPAPRRAGAARRPRKKAD